MNAEHAEELRAAAERGDVQAVTKTLDGDAAAQAMRDDARAFKSLIVSDKAPTVVRPGRVAGALAAFKATIMRSNWIATAAHKRLQARVDELEARIATLEARPLRYEGVHEPGKQYAPGAFVTSGGSVWHCNEATTSRPGDGGAWTLAVKHGRDLR